MKFATLLTVVLEELSFKKIKCCHGNLNNIVTGHKTHKLGRQSSNDHNCQIWFTSLQWLWRKCNLTIISYKSMGAFCCHGNQTKSHIGRLLAFFSCPYPFNICTKLESYCFCGFGGFVIKKILFVIPCLAKKKRGYCYNPCPSIRTSICNVTPLLLDHLS